MNKYRPPTFNFFTSSSFKRSSEKRLETEWINEKLRDKYSKIIASSDMKFFFNAEHETETVLCSFVDFKNSKIPAEKFIYLGEKNNFHYFCIDITGYPGINDSMLKKGQLRELRTIAAFLNSEDAAVLAYARALIYWQNNHKYCGRCGSILKVKDSGHKLICSNTGCASENFPRTDPAVIMLVEKDGRSLLARQPKWPKDRYSTIAGFVEPGESLEQAVQREVLEETGVYVNQIEYHSSQPWPFPASIMLGFRAVADTEEIKLGDNELEEAKWFSRDEIIENIRKGIIGFPPFISVSFKLIQDWFDEESSVPLIEIIRSARRS